MKKSLIVKRIPGINLEITSQFHNPKLAPVNTRRTSEMKEQIAVLH